MNSNYEPFKFATEAGINMHLGSYQLCQQDDFELLGDDPLLPTYNIYFICQRNRISVKPDSMKILNDSLSFVFNVHREDSITEIMSSRTLLDFGKIKRFESEYPHSIFSLINDKNEEIRIKADAFLQSCEDSIFPRPSFLDLEILYVGQTQRNSSAPVIDRLISHQTLQAIYSKKRPDKEIHLLLCNFIFTGAVELRNSVRTQPKYLEEDHKRLLNFMNSQVRITQSDEINITEAALIKYFDPEYNKVHKYFPKKDNKSYEPLYTMDLNAFSIEIDTSLHLFSNRIPTNTRHFETFYLLTDDERRKLFDYSVGFDT